MSSSFDFDQRLTAWLDEQAPMQGPEGLTDVVQARTRRTRQVPGWATLERWLPMETTYKLGAIPRTAITLVILAVLLGTLGAIAIGQQPSPKLPPPIGPARNGLIAFDSNGDIWVTNVDGTGRKQLTSGADVDQSPIFSPDGSMVAFWSQRASDGQTALMVMDPDGGDSKALVEGLTVSLSATSPRAVSWAHDSRRLAYSDLVASGQTRVPRISVMSADGGVPVEVARPGMGPTWSPDDQTIAYRGGGPDGTGGQSAEGLYLVSGAGGRAQDLVTSSDFGGSWALLYPQWSPDGTRLAYAGFNVYVTPVKDPSPLAITQGLGQEYLPVWSPDGARIAFDRVVGLDKQVHFVIVRPDGSDPIELVHPPLWGPWPTWSPDGTWLLGNLSDGTGMLVLDPVGVAQPITLSAPGVVGQSSWQRLAP